MHQVLAREVRVGGVGEKAPPGVDERRMARDLSRLLVIGNQLSLKLSEIRFPHEGLVPLASAAAKVRVSRLIEGHRSTRQAAQSSC